MAQSSNIAHNDDRDVKIALFASISCYIVLLSQGLPTIVSVLASGSLLGAILSNGNEDDESFSTGFLLFMIFYVSLLFSSIVTDVFLDTSSYPTVVWYLFGLALMMVVYMLHYIFYATPERKSREAEEIRKLEEKREEEHRRKSKEEAEAKKKGYTSYEDYRSAMIEEAKEKKREEELRLKEEQEARRKEEEAIIAKKAAKTRRKNKILKEREKVAKPRKQRAFSRDNFQEEHGKISMSQKDKVWNRAKGVCQSCLLRENERNPPELWDLFSIEREEIEEDNLFNSYTEEVSFYWTIFPTLQVVIRCDECAANEELLEEQPEIDARSRNIPTQVKREVVRRDAGKCRLCGSDKDLHFDHDYPFAKGGSNEVENIQLLCKKCNLSKGDKII